MTLFDEPPMVDLHEILDEEDTAEARATPGQLLAVLVGGIVGIAGLLTVLVVTAPTWLQLLRVIAALTSPDSVTAP